MIPAEVCDGQDPVRSTLYGRDIEINNAPGGPEYGNAPCNGFDVTDAVFNVRSSIRRVSEHHMIPAEVCDGQDPIHSTLYGRDIDITVTRHPCIHKV